jgi:hypothetical protein
MKVIFAFLVVAALVSMMVGAGFSSSASSIVQVLR